VENRAKCDGISRDARERCKLGLSLSFASEGICREAHLRHSRRKIGETIDNVMTKKVEKLNQLACANQDLDKRKTLWMKN
jgi:hypothetical protein